MQQVLNLTIAMQNGAYCRNGHHKSWKLDFVFSSKWFFNKEAEKKPIANNSYNSQTVTCRNWNLCSLVSDFSTKNPKNNKKYKTFACKACNC